MRRNPQITKKIVEIKKTDPQPPPACQINMVVGGVIVNLLSYVTIFSLL